MSCKPHRLYTLNKESYILASLRYNNDKAKKLPKQSRLLIILVVSKAALEYRKEARIAHGVPHSSWKT